MENLENVKIISEDISKREKTVKHFDLSDGSMLAVVYPKAIDSSEVLTGDANISRARLSVKRQRPMKVNHN